jgi:zinc protease
VILNPSFPADELERLRPRRLAQIQQEQVQPNAMALRVLPRLLFGEGHAYANPLTGSGTDASVKAITRDSLVKFHRDWFRPNHATLVVVGDTTLAEIRPLLESHFSGWKAGDTPVKNVGTVAHAKQPAVYLMDRPGAVQSVIIAGHVSPPRSDPDDIPIRTMNRVFGGDFTSRINMNLREDKHWSYGAGSVVFDARGQRPFVVFAPVQTDKTKESIAEVKKEVEGLLGPIPMTDDELAKAKASLTLTLPGQWETMGAVASSIQEIVRFGLPDSYFDAYPAKVTALSLADLNRAAKGVVKPGSLVWVVVGDRAKIEESVRSLQIGPVHVLDADGRLLAPGSR